MTNVAAKSTIEKWRKLVDLLVDLTAIQKISWKESADEDEFLALISGSYITIRRNGSQDVDRSDRAIHIEISSVHGKKIDEFTDDVLDRNTGGFSYYHKMNNLVSEIARSLSGADDILDGILAELEADCEIPF